MQLNNYYFTYTESPKEKKEEARNSDNNNNDDDDNKTTNRCIDCSRESWKTKRFTNIGMNTEISCNPSKDLDPSTITSTTNNNTSNNNNTSQQQPLLSPQSTNGGEKHNFATTKPPTSNQQQHSPSSAPHSNSRHNPSFNIKKEYAPLQHHPINAKQMLRKNGGHHHEEERPVTSPTYGVEMYTHTSSQLRYPSLEAPPAHYERFVQPHGWLIDRPGRYEQVTRSSHGTISPISRRSPSNRRSRSPISPRAGEFLPHAHYHAAAAAAFHAKYRPVLLPTSHHYLHGGSRRRGGESRQNNNGIVPADVNGTHDEKMLLVVEQPTTTSSYGAKKENHIREKSASQLNDLHAEKLKRVNNNNAVTNNNSNNNLLQPGDEPPVFVLPNDYDVVSGIDPRIASMQEKRSGKFSPTPIAHADNNNNSSKDDEKTTKEERNNKDLHKDEFQNSPGESVGSSNGVGGGNTNGAPDSPPTNNSQKLYCKICSGVFPTKSLLYKHLRGHTSDEKPFKCNECGQGFTLSSNLRQHRIIHRGYKPFQCEFCGKKFMRSNVYKQHRRIHTGEEMHKCSLCPSEFLQKYALLKHMKKNHDIDAVDN